MSFQIYVNKEQDKYVSVLEFVNNLYKHASPQATLKVILNYLFECYQKPINDLELYKKEESSGQLTFHLIDVFSPETSQSILQRISKCLDDTQIGLNFSDECLRPYKKYYFKFTDASEFYSYLRANDSESELTEDRARELLKEGAIEKLAVNDKRNTAFMNNSLASYVSEYTLPQVVALILHIDLADITTSPSNSYINNQNKYGGEVYQKFENLLQSYSIAALNNKVDGAEVHTRIAVPFGGGQEVYVNLEKTTISKSNLASYLSSIGCQLDDLIAKQEPIHGVQSESGQVLRLTQQLTELQEQLMTEKSLQAEIREEAIEANVKILNLTAKLEDAELDSIIHSHPAHKSLLSDAQATIDQLSKENAELRANKEASTSQPKYVDKVSDQTVEKLKKMTADYEELSLKYERINTQNKELLDKTEQHQQDNNEELIQHWEAERKKYQSKIEDLETVIEGFSDVETLSQDGDWQLYNWETMNVSQYPPELHLAIEVWKRYYKVSDVEYTTQFNTGKFNRITKELNLKNGNLKDRIRSILTPLQSKKTSLDLLTTLRDVDVLYNDKMPD